MENYGRGRRRHEGRIFAGLILVCAGAALLLRNAGFPVPYWLFSWPVLLIILGLYSGVKHNFRNSLWIILIAIGGFFLADRFIPDLRLAPFFWPVAIIALGLVFILRPERDKWINAGDEKKSEGDNDQNNWKQSGDDFLTESNDYLRIRSVFSGVQRNVVSKNLKGGKINCVFGGADIDLTQAELSGTAEIKVEILFGGIKLVIPPHWTVYNEIDGVFHGVDDKRKFNTAAGTSPEKILVLKGSMLFGGLDIRSY